MIRIKNLSKQFDQFLAVNNLSFDVHPGEVLGFLGPNGAGKSTTMKMITGFLTPTQGTVELYDKDILTDGLAAKQMIGYLPEGAPCYGDMTVAEFLSFIAEVRGFSGKEIPAKVQTVVEKLQLGKVLNRPVETLSKGFKRRVGLAQAIIHDPKILVLDEPTDGLDPNQKHQVRSLIQNLSKDKIVIISTHILEEVAAVCTRAVIIANGKLLADGTPESLEARSRYFNAVTVELEEPANAYQRLNEIMTVAEVERLNESGTHLTVIPKPGETILHAVSEMINAEGWKLKQLYVERGRLDEVFRTVTEEAA